MSEFQLSKFVASPSTKYLGECVLRKDDWIELAKHYKVSVRTYWKKAKVCNEVISKLVDLELLDDSAFDLCEDDGSNILALRKLELEFERERLMLETKEREAERKFQLEMLQKKHDLGIANSQGIVNEGNFDVSRCGKLVPEFDENDPDEFLFSSR